MEDRRILEQFPLPLARGYRRYLNAPESKERHDLGYFLFEIYLKYLSATAIAAYLASPERDHRVNAALKGLLRPSLGEWLRFLRECLEFAGRREDPDPVTRSIAALFKEKDARAPRCLQLFNRMRSFRTDQHSEKEAIHLGGFLEELVAFRNRTLGHGAPLGQEHYRAFGDLFGPAFAELLDRSPFLTSRRLVSFDSTRVEEGSWVECAVIEYMGNQPVRRQMPHRVRYGEPVPREKVLYLLSDMDGGESGGLLAIDPLLVAHREDVYVLNEAQGVPEYLSYSTGEHHRPSDLGGKQGELFEKILGYRVDETRMSQMGDELASTAETAASLDSKDGEKRLGDYRIVREVGRGAMGTVFEAFQESLGRRVALKVLPGSFALEPRRLERFRREARATARIHHPSIVPVYEVGESGGTHYYSMEFVDGASLEDLLARARKEAETEAKKAWRKSSSTSDPAAVARTVERLASLAEGLEEAHRLGLIHRDVKPSNILVEGVSPVPEPSMPLAGDAGRCVLVDFGLVHDVEAQTLTRSGEMVGTLGYMSPEQVSKGEVDARADVYSLGATLYEVLTLRTPFDGKSEHEIHRAILFEEPPPPRRHNPRLHRDLETIVLKCMEKNPERRYASAGALAKDLRRFLRYEPIEARPQSAWSRLGNRAWKHRRSLGVTGITAVLLLSVLFFALLSRKEARLRREAEYGPRVLAALMKIDQTDLSQVSWTTWPISRKAEPGETSTHLGGPSQVQPEPGIDTMAEAVAALGNEIASVPERPEAYYHRARAFQLAKRDDDALGDLARVTAIDRGFVPALVLEAEIREKRGEEEKSAALRERARAAGKVGWKEKWIHAQAALKNGLWADADRALGEIIALEADGGEAYLGASFLTRLWRGRARLEAKDYLGAIDDFAVVEARWPEAREAVLLKGKAYHLLGHKREAEALFERVHADAPTARKDEVALAVSQIFRWREPETALRWCAKVKLEFLREQASVWTLWVAGRIEDAVQAGQRAIALNPAFAPSYADLSFVLTKLRRFTEAIRYSRRAIELRPSDAYMHLCLGFALRNIGRSIEALAVFEEASRLDPTMAVAHTHMASVLTNLGELELAEDHHQRARDLQPLEIEGLYTRGVLLSGQERVAEALAEFDRAISVDPTFSWPHVKKGLILEQQGKLEEAMTEYRTATGLFPAAGNGHRWIGRLLEGQGKFDDALAEYVKTLEVGDGAGAPNRDTHLAAQRLLGRRDVSLAAAGLERLVAVLEAALPFEGEYPELLRTLALARSLLPGTSDIAKAIEPIHAALARKGGKDPALSLVLGEALLLDARPEEALAVLEAAARHPHSTAAIATTAGECRKALLPGLATPASVEEAVLVREREVLVPEDAVWRYFPGTSEPSEGLHWTGPGFDDGSWKEGKSGFGYGDGDDATVLPDMQGGYSTLYIRRKFTVSDPGRYERFILSLRVNDGAVVCLNGAEAGRTRAGTSGARLPHDAFGSMAPQPLVAVELSIEPSRLAPGDNVLAIQGLNVRNSTDFSLIPGLFGELPRDPARTGKLLEAVKTRPEGEPGSGLLDFLEGLLLLEEGKRPEAAAKLERAARAFPKDPLPHLRLAGCLRAAGEAKGAEAALRRAIEGGPGDCREVWDLWAAVSLADLKRNAAEILADYPKVPGAQPAASGESGPAADLRWLLEVLARGDGIRIHCGGEGHVAKDGRAWSRDRFFRSGFRHGEQDGHPHAFTLGIEKTDDDPLYQSQRWFPADHIHPPGYRIPLPPGEYQVTLHFAEFYYRRPGARSFGALLEGREVLAEYEPLEAGFATAEAKTFRARVDDGLLELGFVRAADNPMVSAIEIQRLR